MPSASAGDVAIAEPTKRFFVSMLTRDISLSDAILDLVDNCLDGALRLAGDDDVDYSCHAITIECTGEHFRIEDDCGGIPREIAKEYAFKMGREADDERDSTTETIGMYGVGMKRAIFKMGKESLVRTLHDRDAFEVPISADWLDAKGWKPLPVKAPDRGRKLKQPGTVVEVSTLFPSVSKQFQRAAFIDELIGALGEHFTLFLQRGLTITVNGNPVKPVHVEVLVSNDAKGPAPYMFKKTIDDVTVSIVVGLNTGRGPSGDEDADFEHARSAVTAGWSVFCNDRAIIVGDKSRLTGWGDGVPMYHYQFSVITGIVEFRSASADKLPITTTKRALDTSSDLWLEARSKMREGLRIFITHTNAWKNHPRSDQTGFWKSAKPLQLSEAVEVLESREPTKKQDGGIEFDPKKKQVLPVPKSKVPSSRRITFSRPKAEIEEVSFSLFDHADEKPGIVGEECFKLILQKIREEGEE